MIGASMHGKVVKEKQTFLVLRLFSCNYPTPGGARSGLFFKKIPKVRGGHSKMP